MAQQLDTWYIAALAEDWCSVPYSQPHWAVTAACDLSSSGSEQMCCALSIYHGSFLGWVTWSYPGGHGAHAHSCKLFDVSSLILSFLHGQVNWWCFPLCLVCPGLPRGFISPGSFGTEQSHLILGTFKFSFLVSSMTQHHLKVCW